MNPIAAIWYELGFIRYPLAFAFLATMVLTLASTYQVLRPNAWADLRTKALVDGILFWGGFAAVAGIFGTLGGIIVAAQAIEAADGVSSSLVWGGIKISMLSSAFGMFLLLVAGLIWFALQLRWRFLEAREQDRAAA